FTAHGGLTTPTDFEHGMIPALWTGTALIATGTLAVLATPRRRGLAAVTGPLPALSQEREREEESGTAPV
ncbi:hypothetical protein ACWD3W_32835, partial [Streptomyces sp. NPDC002644]